MRLKNTIDDCYELAKTRYGKCLSVDYINSGSKYLWECEFKHQWLAVYNNVRRGSWCPHCSGTIKLTIDYCNQIANYNNGICLSAEYLGAHSLLKWECHLGHKWDSTYANISVGRWCPHCSGTIKQTIDDCHKIAKYNNGVCLSTEYITSKTKYLWKCAMGHQWKSSYNNIQQDKWCPYCGGTTKLKIEDCHQVAKSNNGRCLSAEYINARTKYLWQCKIGHQWTAFYYSIKSGQWCPKCKNKTQTFIFTICEKLFPNYQIKYNFKNFDWLKSNKGWKLELDIYIPELKLAIEYDGEQHFKPVTFGNISIKRAKNNLKMQKERDLFKEQKIIENSKDVKYFIRFDYMENLTEEYIINKIQDLIMGA